MPLFLPICIKKKQLWAFAFGLLLCLFLYTDSFAQISALDNAWAIYPSTNALKDSSNNNRIALLVWNIYLLPPHTFMRIGQKKRAEPIAQALLDATVAYDVVVFSEAFHRRARQQIGQKLRAVFPYQVGPLNKGGFLKTNGGVWIVSRYPLQFLGQIKFNDCAGADCWARKGALLVELEKNGQRIQLVGTHLQADEGVRRDSIRMRQYRAIRDGLLLPYETAGVPQLICGDLNTLPQSATYTPMQQIWGASDGPLEGKLQLSWPAKDFCKPGQKTCFLYDYALVRPNGKKNVRVDRQLHTFRTEWQHKGRQLHDLSDHYALEIQFFW